MVLYYKYYIMTKWYFYGSASIYNVVIYLPCGHQAGLLGLLVLWCRTAFVVALVVATAGRTLKSRFWWEAWLVCCAVGGRGGKLLPQVKVLWRRAMV